MTIKREIILTDNKENNQFISAEESTKGKYLLDAHIYKGGMVVSKKKLINFINELTQLIEGE